MPSAVPAGEPQGSAALRDPWVLLFFVVGLALRIGLALALDRELEPRGDERTYLLYAAELRQTGRLETGEFVRPPLYFALLAAVQALTPWWAAAPGLGMRLFQALLGALAVIPVHRAARRIGGPQAARVAAAVLLLDPTLVAYTHLLWPETVFTFVSCWIFDQVALLGRRPDARAAWTGLAIGAALLLKPVFGIFCLVLAASWLVRLGPAPALRLALVVGGAAALVVAPWVVRNQLRYGPGILLENQAAYNLWLGNSPQPAREIRWQWHRLPDPVTRNRVALEQGIDAVRSDPAAFAARSVLNVVDLWGLEWFVLLHVVIGGYGEVGRAGVLAAFWGLQSAWALVFVLAALGLPRTLRDGTLRLVAAYAALFTLLVAGMLATTRFRVPFAFLTAVSAGVGLHGLWSRGLRRTSLAAAAVAVLLLAASAARPPFSLIATARFERVEELRLGEWRALRY